MFLWEPSTLPSSRRERMPSRFLVLSVLLSCLNLVDYNKVAPHIHHQSTPHQPGICSSRLPEGICSYFSFPAGGSWRSKDSGMEEDKSFAREEGSRTDEQALESAAKDTACWYEQNPG